MTSCGSPSAILRPATSTTRRWENARTARIICIGDQQPRFGCHGPSKLQLAHFDLGEVGGFFVGLGQQAHEVEQFLAALPWIGRNPVTLEVGGV
jgi:hypothetical protein